MADLEEHNPGFEITASLDGENKIISIQPDETSDGVKYFICKFGDDQLSQIRQDEGKWHQLWGELNEEEVNEIGQQIQQKQK